MTSRRISDRRQRGLRPALPACWLAIFGLACASGHAQEDARGDSPTEIATPAESQDSSLEASRSLVATTVEQFGKRSLQAAEAQFDLAEALRRSGDHDAAAESYLASIDTYRSVDGPFTALAIRPLTSLGDSYREDGDNLSAVSAYSEARTVNRRVFGLLNEEQIPLIDRLSQTLLDLNKPLEADQQQLEALHIIERTYPPESDEALAGIYKYASWLGERGLYQSQRDQYMRALRVIRDHYGKDDVHSVPALVGMANSFRMQRIPEGQGAGALEDALALLSAEENTDPLTLAGVLRDLGDWQVAFSKVGYDGAEYRRAWQLLGQAPNGEELRREWFSGPTYVLREPISLRGLSEAPDAPRGHVVVSFDLDAFGTSSNVAVVEAEPAGLKDEAVLRHIRRSRFRPQMVDGELVARSGIALQFNFRYDPEAVDNDKK